MPHEHLVSSCKKHRSYKRHTTDSMDPRSFAGSDGATWTESCALPWLWLGHQVGNDVVLPPWYGCCRWMMMIMIIDDDDDDDDDDVFLISYQFCMICWWYWAMHGTGDDVCHEVNKGMIWSPKITELQVNWSEDMQYQHIRTGYPIFNIYWMIILKFAKCLEQWVRRLTPRFFCISMAVSFKQTCRHDRNTWNTDTPPSIHVYTSLGSA